MSHLLENKYVHIMVNYSRSSIPQVEDKTKGYTSRDIKRDNRARRFQNITGQPINKIQHAFDNNILKNLSILKEDVGMAEDIYGHSIPQLKGKIVRRKIQHVEPVKIPSVHKTILDGYKDLTIVCDLMYINGVYFLNTISRHIIFSTGSMIRNRKIKSIVDGIMQVHNLYLQRGFNITCMRADSKFKPLCTEMTALGINLNCASKKEYVPVI